MTSSFAPSVLAAAFLCSIGPAQGGVRLGSEPFSTPIHRAADGLWSARSDFKACFDDGFTFYPLVGPDRVNAPLRWQTTAVTVGGADIGGLPGLAAQRVSDDRVELKRGTWIEAYDVRGDGVEQTFVFYTPFSVPGELVIVGRVQTRLEAAPLSREHGGLAFCDSAGQPLLTYGKAWVFDAAGKRAAVTTTWDGAEVRLHVSAEFLNSASFPVTVDPLTSSVTLEAGFEPVVDIDLASDPAGGPGSLIAVYSRAFAANDLDGYAKVVNPSFTGAAVVFSDVSALYSTKEGQCAWVGDAQSWALAFEREHLSPTTSEILTYFHDRNDPTLNNGRSTVLSRPPGTTARNPDIGGRAVGGGMNALVVYQLDTTTTQVNTPYTEVFGALVDASTGGEVSLTDLGWFPSGTTYDREHPTVTKLSEGRTTYWMVCWHEFFTPAAVDDWDVNLTRITFTGQKTAKLIRLGKSAHPWNKRFPQVDGGDGRFLVSYVFGSSFGMAGEEIHTQRFYWPDPMNEPVVEPDRVLVSDTRVPDFAFPRVAYDTNTRSHWAISYVRRAYGDLFVSRVGHTGGVVEFQTVFAPLVGKGTGVAVDFTPADGGSFPLVYAADGPGGASLVGQRFTYPSGAQNLPYGVGCSGQIGASAPYAGSEFFAVSLSGAQPNAVAALAMAGGGSNLSLGAIGAPGCSLMLGAPIVWVPAAADPNGDASLTLALPDGPGSVFDLYFQWAHVSIGANPLGVVTTRGLQSQIR